MNFFKHIATAFYKSLYDIHWIAQQRGYLARALAYFFVFLFVTLCILLGILGRTASPRLSEVWDDIRADAPDATLTISEGTLSVTGLDQPYRHEFAFENGVTGVLYVDTVTTSSVALNDILGEADHVPVVLVTSKKIKMYDASGAEPFVENMSSFPNTTLRTEEVTSVIDGITAGRAVVGILLLLSLIVTVFVFGTKLVSLLVVAWLVYVVVRADKKAWTYRQIYTAGLYALTIPILVDAISMLVLGAPLPFVHTILLFVILFGIIYKGETKAPHVHEHTVPPSPPPPPSTSSEE